MDLRNRHVLPMRECFHMCPFRFKNQWTDSHEIWCEGCATVRHTLGVIFSFPQSVKQHGGN